MVGGSCGVDTGALGFLAGFAWALSVALDLLSATVRACLLNPDSLALFPWVLRVQVHERDLWQRGRCSGHWRVEVVVFMGEWSIWGGESS